MNLYNFSNYDLFTKKEFNIAILIAIPMLLIGGYFGYKAVYELRKEAFKYKVAEEVIGVVDSIHSETASIYYFIGSEKHTFGQTEPNMRDFVQVGDSLIKKTGNDFILIKRYDHEGVFIEEKKFKMKIRL